MKKKARDNDRRQNLKHVFIFHKDVLNSRSLFHKDPFQRIEKKKRCNKMQTENATKCNL